MCGEQTPRLLVACYRSGSSPRVRGTEGEYCVDEVVHGIIPAYVGSSWPDTGSGTSRWDHPCVCGEQPQSWAEPYRGSGSSPRMRGAASSTQAPLSSAGIIPARAGSRHSQGASWPPLGDHPRACGEQFASIAGMSADQGSSPRVRGAGVLEGEHRLRRGIIPARAGSRNGATHCPSARRDHPRACGEQVERSIMSMGVTRSSPRMRGAVLLIVTSPLDSGIIPACAGSSSRSRPRGTGSWDHPRVCGEQAYLSILYISILGSSPRVRGAAEWVPSYFDFQGIIPARAGSRTQRGLDIGSSRDHPRACGEQSWTFRDDETSVGSSPRVRGAAATHHDRAELMRIIPARAGSRDGGHPRCNRYRDHPRACGEQGNDGFR